MKSGSPFIDVLCSSRDQTSNSPSSRFHGPFVAFAHRSSIAFNSASFIVGPSELEPLLLMVRAAGTHAGLPPRSEEHTSELQSLMRISYAVFCLKKQQRTT